MRQALGQHFLTRGAVIHKILMNLQLHAGDQVLEIGPGRGALTIPLAEKVGKLLLVEKDPVLATAMETKFAESPQVKVVHRDFLEWDTAQFAEHFSGPFKVVSNLPYQVSTAILMKLLRAVPAGTLMVLMFQKEVADRLLAVPRSKAYGSLTIAAQSLADMKQICLVPPSAFSPPPKVHSTVLRVKLREKSYLPADEQDAFEALLHEGFKQRRKMLRQLLRAIFGGITAENIEQRLRSVGGTEKARAEELSLEQWLLLYRQWKEEISH